MSNYNKSPQNANNFIVFDFETGGLDSNKNPVTEIALISLEGGNLEIIESYQSLIAKYDDTLFYDPRAEKVSGISEDLIISEGVDIKTVAQQTLQFLKNANTRQEKNAGLKPILVGHNVAFDIDFLHHLFHYGLGKDYQKQMKDVLHGREDRFGNFQPSYIDTWSVCKPWFQDDKELTDYKLSTVAEKLGVDLNNAHRAMNDVVSTVEVLRRYLINLRSSYTTNHKGQRQGFYFPI